MSDDESVGDIENDLEIILDGVQEDYTEEQPGEVDGVENNENQENTEYETRKEVKPKRVVKNPQPKLNEQTLKGPKGLAAIESYFERVKFKGTGHEEEDLNVLLKTYEYWCHRLFPKFPFDSCIARLEKLGTKRATQTQLKKIRMGLNIDIVENTILNEEELNVTEGFVDTYNDQFDQIVSTTSTTESESQISEEQLERMQQNMEKAKRLREEKLRKLQANTQNLEKHNNRPNITSVAADGHNQNNINESQDSDIMQTDDENEVGENEDDIDNILEYINTDENTVPEKNSDIEVSVIENPSKSQDNLHSKDKNNFSEMDTLDSSPPSQLENTSCTDSLNDCQMEIQNKLDISGRSSPQENIK